MAQINLEIIPQLLVDSFNKKDFNQALELISDKAEWLDIPTHSMFRGKEGYRKFENGWLKAFPDAKIELKSVIIGKNQIVSEYIGRGTHQGAIEGPDGLIQPTGNRVELKLCDVMNVADGMITGGHTYYDAATLLRQISNSSRLAA